jgi:cytochrome P450
MFPPGTFPAALVPIEVDPPDHQEWRHILNPFFAPRAIAERESGIRAMTDELIDAFFGSGSCDIVNQFTRPLPGRVFFKEILGFTGDALEEAWLAADAAVNGEQNPDITDGVPAPAHGRLLEVVRRLIESSRSGSDNALLRAILGARIAGEPASEDVMVGAISLLVLGGLETTTNVLTNSLFHLALYPELRKTVVTERAATSAAVEEFLRLYAPTPYLSRVVVEDTEFAGCRMRKGDKLQLSFAAANRDEDAFRCPAAYDADRDRNRHVAFGVGIHRCLGSHLARSVLRIGIEQACARLPNFRISSHDSALGRKPGLRIPEELHFDFDVPPAG